VGDRRSARLVLTAGVALFAIAYLTFATATGVAGVAVAFLVAGLGIGCVETAEHAAVATATPADLRGSAFGLLAGVQAAGNFVASAVAGAIWTAVSPTAAFGCLAAGCAAAVALLVISQPRANS
jgi:MFS family permease